MRFQVPQFIEVEDKIFGPFTFKQFVYLAGGAGIVVMCFSILPKFLAFLVAVPVVALALALTFFQVNNKPFVFILEALVKYVMSNKLYVWKKDQKAVEKKIREGRSYNEVVVPKLSQSKLKDLSWTLEVKSTVGNTPTAADEDQPSTSSNWDDKLKSV
ncbi:MAG: hypothetical protein A3E94_00470 [Candidatus Zambryskibacteria bacterium RIFCSPHIGHO2_12_FULL_44_12b]|uniref:PrgI family protein n=1 Tax=Candidatus Zambryskibacteria bacterium RIFCSPLOWO2_01_FULL_45_21 TaxID=1802761 RepID=A0A1G2U4D4_9BACT|nr:MAG: hypothetical protein A3E94_00470 [Candidatus Zambryskibacteria bacterium RIFCSPHIGHO2_12_FULL_44_12b]OHB04355.1 MAG: hypothetical protein A3B14_02725 [Candidatus Zambryskibacteria bacterium RIFCSPLOWO2_01_FULL_45_21]